MARERHGLDQGRVVELEFDLPRIVLLVVVLAIIVASAFFLGRLTATGTVAAEAAGEAPQQTIAEEGEFAPGSGSIFDQVGEDASPRSLGRQVTRELSLGGRFEIDLGTVASRSAADSLRSKAEAAGVPAVVVGADGGAYRVAAGPFSTENQARRAAGKLTKALGRQVQILGNAP